MNVQQYLLHLLSKNSRYQLTSPDLKFSKKEGVEKYIYTKLTSKKFRKFKMDPACIERTKQAINFRVRENKPIHIIYPQGGYKLWRFPSSPNADWAEFFNISYLLEYVGPIAAVYKPGVEITYYMHTLLMELHDNLTTEEIQAYVGSFEKLLGEFRKYLPPNIQINILRDADLYSRNEYFAALEKGKILAEDEYLKWDQKRKDDFKRMALLNIKWNGKEDWTELSEEEKNKKIYFAALYESAATTQLDKVVDMVKSSENILVFTKGSSAFIGIGSTKASIAKYWVGFGVLQKKQDSFLPIILTPSQYQYAIKKKYQTVKVDVIHQKNFSEILVFEKPFEFSKQ